MVNKEELAQMSGEANLRGGGVPNVKCDDISIQSKSGAFVRTFLTRDKENNQYPQEPIGDSIDIVFLKIRRKLVEYDTVSGMTIRNTSEHNHKGDVVTMFEGSVKQRETAEVLKGRFPSLKTVQVIYALLVSKSGKTELVRLNVRGSSLGSFDEEGEGPMKFYRYLSSFQNDEHVWEYKTNLVAVSEVFNDPVEGEKQYYSIGFNRGAKLADKQLETVAAKMRDVFQQIEAYDAQFVSQGAGLLNEQTRNEVNAENDAESRKDVIDYPEEDIDVDQIPF